MVVKVIVIRAFTIRKHEHHGAIKFLNFDIWSIRTIEDLEAVVEQALSFIVGYNNTLDREQRSWIVGVTRPNSSCGDEVKCSRGKRERPCVVQASFVLTVVRRLKPILRCYRRSDTRGVVTVARIGK